MRTVQSNKGPFAQRPFFTPSEIERLCSSELRGVGLLPGGPQSIRIDRFIEKRFGISHEYADLPDGVLGYTKFGPRGVEAIVVSASLEVPDHKPSERRLRSTLAHEAGHGIMHAHLFAMGQRPPSLFEDDGKRPEILCRDFPGEHNGARRYQGKWWEFQANKAIGGLLMPQHLVVQAASDYLVDVGGLGARALGGARRDACIVALSDVFDVNPAVARLRLDEIFPAQATGQLSL